MPANIKLMLSLVALAVGASLYYWEKQAGNEQLSWIVAALAAFMVLAMWIFPETEAHTGGKS